MALKYCCRITFSLLKTMIILLNLMDSTQQLLSWHEIRIFYGVNP